MRTKNKATDHLVDLKTTVRSQVWLLAQQFLHKSLTACFQQPDIITYDSTT